MYLTKEIKRILVSIVAENAYTGAVIVSSWTPGRGMTPMGITPANALAQNGTTDE